MLFHEIFISEVSEIILTGRLCFRMLGAFYRALLSQLIDWFFRRLLDWLIACFLDRLIAWLIDWSIDWLAEVLKSYFLSFSCNRPGRTYPFHETVPQCHQQSKSRDVSASAGGFLRKHERQYRGWGEYSSGIFFAALVAFWTSTGWMDVCLISVFRYDHFRWIYVANALNGPGMRSESIFVRL